MNLSRQNKFALWFASAVLIAVASYFAGTLLKPGAEPHYLFETHAPAYAPPSVIAATSPGGFTGFGETDGSASRVVLGGRVVELTDGGLTLEGPDGQRTALRFGEMPRIFRLEGADVTVLRPGLRVTVRLNEAGDTAEGVLVLSQP